MFLTDSTKLISSIIIIKVCAKLCRGISGATKGSAKKAIAPNAPISRIIQITARIFAAVGDISASSLPIFVLPLHFSKTEISLRVFEIAPDLFALFIIGHFFASCVGDKHHNDYEDRDRKEE